MFKGFSVLAVLYRKNDGGLDEGKEGFGHSLKAVIFTNCGVSYDLFTVLLTMGLLARDPWVSAILVLYI